MLIDPPRSLRTLPVKASGPVTRMPNRFEPCAKGPSRSPSLSASVAVKSSRREMTPVLPTLPVRPPSARIPVALFTPVKAIVPRLLTLLLLSSVTAAPAVVGFTEPAVSIVRSSGPPAAVAVDVLTGAVTAVAILVSAWAAAAHTSGSRAAETNSRFMEVLLPPARRVRERTCQSSNTMLAVTSSFL